MKKQLIIIFFLISALLPFLSQAPAFADCPPSSTVQNNCILTNYIKPGINFLSAGVGIVIVAMIIIGAIQYTASANNPQSVAAARKKIANALLALLVFALMYAFLNFIVPGGIVSL